MNVLSQSDLIEAVRELSVAETEFQYASWSEEWGDDLITTITEAGKVKARLDRVVHFMAMAVKASTSLITQLGALIAKCHGGVVLVAQINPIVQKTGGEIIGHSFCAEGAVLFDDPPEVQAYAEKKLLEQGDAAVAARGGDVEAERQALVAELEKSKRRAFRQKKRTKKRKPKARAGPVAVPDLKKRGGSLLEFAHQAIGDASEEPERGVEE